MADRIAPGGNTTIVLGSDSSKDMFLNRQKARETNFETPDAVARFPYAPGGEASVCFGEAAPSPAADGARGPVGGAATICLGSDSSKQMFEERERDHSAAVETSEALARFPQAPGGTTSVCLGGASAEGVPVRGPVGGAATVCLGSDDAKAMFNKQAEQDLETPAAAPRFPQAPGGDASVCFGGDGANDVHVVRGPVGGNATIDLSDAAEGASDVSIGTRGPIGGEDTVTLGMDDSKAMFSHRSKDREADIETPEATARFPQAPGGHSSVCLGGAAAQPGVAVRGPVGGPDSVSIALDPSLGPGADDAISTRGPVGGAATIVLGGASSAEAFTEHERKRTASVETPDALLRFPQAPGGDASVALGGAATVEVAPSRGPVGGSASIVLGGEDFAQCFDQRRQEREALVETPDAAPRFPQAPGGNTSIEFGGKLEPVDETAPTRGPVGGPATIVLGSDDAQVGFEEYKQQRDASIETPDALMRFPQAPGGSSSISFGGNADSSQGVPSTRGPVGGATHVVFGEDSVNEVYREYSELHNHPVDTPDAAPRFQQAPGGSASINFGSDGAVAAHSVRGPVGGAVELVLGSDDSKADFQQRKDAREAQLETPDAVPRFSQAPGGTASIILGGNEGPKAGAQEPSQTRVAPGGSSTFALVLGGEYPHDLLEKVSANKFASGANQNCGNSITEKPTTRVHHAPGGQSTLCLGEEPAQPCARVAQVSSNKFACGANQNAGNMLTERPTTRLHQAPGGDSSLCLGGGYPHDIVEASKLAEAANPRVETAGVDRRAHRLQQSPGGNTTICLEDLSVPVASGSKMSSNRFANGANQNSGNTLTDRPSTRIHCAPGGASTICLGGGDENVNTANIIGSESGSKEGLKHAPIKNAPPAGAALSPAVIA